VMRVVRCSRVALAVSSGLVTTMTHLPLALSAHTGHGIARRAEY
jgi:hypothetical protein